MDESHHLVRVCNRAFNRVANGRLPKRDRREARRHHRRGEDEAGAGAREAVVE